MDQRILVTSDHRITRARAQVAIAAAVLSVVVACSPAHAGDVVMEWNQIALAATVTAGQGALPQIRSMAIVHVAVHDALNAMSGEYYTYRTARRPPAGASADAAAIAAAHRALSSLFPAQAPALDAARDASLAARALSSSDPGIAFGAAVAADIVALRESDLSAQAQFAYAAPDAGQPGVWVAIGTAPAQLPGWGNVG